MSGLMAILVAVGCSSSPTDPAVQTSGASQTGSVEIVPGEVETRSGLLSTRLTARVRDAQGNIVVGDVEWSTNDPSVAIVDGGGMVWSFSTGTATATATFPGKSGSAPGKLKKSASVQVVEETLDRPGQVTDLSVSSTTASSATLSFTEVDDGQGGAADYLVRFEDAPLSWGSASDATSGSCAAPLHGSGAGSSISCTVESLAAETSYQFQVVAIRPSDDVHGDLSNVASGSTPRTESESTPTDGSRPNEPAGLSTIASVDFTNGISAQTGVCRELGDTWKQSNTEYIADATAPTGSGSVFRGKFPSGMKDGGSSWRFDCWGPDIAAGTGQYDYEELYVSYWLKIEGSDFENQTQGTKTFYIAHGSTIRSNHSAGRLNGTFQDQAIMDRMTRSFYIYEMEDDGSDAGGGANHRPPNVSNEKVTPGQWQHLEMWARVNSIGPTQDDGEIKMWTDGVLTHHLTGLRWRSDENPKGFYHLQFTPVYGGSSGDVRTRDDFWRIDEVYISGR